jgi:hypothetical protein
MKLDLPLGHWLRVPRNTWFSAYCLNDSLYWRRRDDTMIYILTKSLTSGFYHYSDTATSVPLDSHPIVFQQVGEALWSQRPYLPGSPVTPPPLPPGHMIENTLCHPTKEIITLGSDGSVHLDQQVATCAWVIHSEVGSHASACFLLSGISSPLIVSE